MGWTKRLKEDIKSFQKRDPAARSGLEVALFYPGFHAVVTHRIAHYLWTSGWRLSARLISGIGRFFHQIEIHPAARIGRRLVIDHGCGLVIGETAQIGDDVTLYQAVTLGGIAPSRNSRQQRRVKRHPTLKNGVIIGSGAQILGPVTVGAHACVGANAVVLENVAASATVVGVPARQIQSSKRDHAQFVAYGTTADCDGLEKTIARLTEDVRHLRSLVEKENGTTPRPKKEHDAAIKETAHSNTNP